MATVTSLQKKSKSSLSRKSSTSMKRAGRTSRSKSKTSADIETEQTIKQLEDEIKSMHDKELRKGCTLDRLKIKVNETKISLDSLV